MFGYLFVCLLSCWLVGWVVCLLACWLVGSFACVCVCVCVCVFKRRFCSVRCHFDYFSAVFETTTRWCPVSFMLWHYMSHNDGVGGLLRFAIVLIIQFFFPPGITSKFSRTDGSNPIGPSGVPSSAHSAGRPSSLVSSSSPGNSGNFWNPVPSPMLPGLHDHGSAVTPHHNMMLGSLDDQHHHHHDAGAVRIYSYSSISCVSFCFVCFFFLCAHIVFHYSCLESMGGS